MKNLLLGILLSSFIMVSYAQDTSQIPAPVEKTPIEQVEETKQTGLKDQVDGFFGHVNGFIDIIFTTVPLVDKKDAQGNVLYDEDGRPKKDGVPFVLLLMVLGGIFFTIRFSLVNIKLFKHSIDVVRGKFDKAEDDGEISHFQALTSALSATVGLGNIAGVAVAIAAGGPGAVFWMWLVAFCGMSMKFCSCTLAQLYRRNDSQGHVLGGPMIYLEEGFTSLNPSLKWLGKAFAVFFAVAAVFTSLGGGNMFQGAMTYQISAEVIPGLRSETFKWLFGFSLAIIVGIVIVGGIKRIGNVTSKAVPFMCVFYCAVCLLTVIVNITEVPSLIASIFQQAFSPEAAYGGFFGVMMQGVRRAAFSNEAGVGSAAIAHAAAKTDEPVREGAVAMLGPFIDTICVCTLTALAILITKVDQGVEVSSTVEGAVLTAKAFAVVHPVCQYLLVIAVAIFAVSSMISWSYYGERAIVYLGGVKLLTPYRIFFSIFVVLGPVVSLNHAIDFSDYMLFYMAIPNILGMVLLSGKIKSMIKDYKDRDFGKIPPAEDVASEKL
ncbi:MAG: alanine:cation symporter family protein [Lentisphaeria bacterium]|nr:alanine:cation symporter family protein [Lentisphaeria bacterium]